MPERIVVYLRRPVELDVAALWREIDDADLYTLAEVLDLPAGEEAAVAAMRPHLRFERRRGDDGRSWVLLHWKSGGRPVRIESSPVLAGEIAEIVDELPATPAAARVRDLLGRCGHAVTFEMGVDDARDLAAVLAEVLAFWAAEAGDGIVWFYHHEWVLPQDRGHVVLRG